jgi:pyruvate,water dikinase
VDVYWADFIPFAHGARLFGQVYNERVKPKDPYEFVDLLETSEIKSLERNRRLEALAEVAKENVAIWEALAAKKYDAIDRSFLEQAMQYSDQFFQAPEIKPQNSSEPWIPDTLCSIILEMAKHPVRRQAKDVKNRNALQKAFLDCFEGRERQDAEELLDLARTSYRLRDDDNIYLGQIEKEMDRALTEAGKRLKKIGMADLDVIDPADIVQCLKDKTHVPDKLAAAKSISHKFTVRARQLIGQPAVHGIACGNARVITDRSALKHFKSGEVLVCDAIDPNMTFVVPLAAAIVERRGGMLIHGAIIAREYGIACVTGVPDATEQIQTGDFVTVDGFLGIVTVERPC